MKLKNTTEWSDAFLRRMVAWCCRQVEISPRDVRRADFGKRSRGPYNGRAWGSGRIRIVIGPASAYPVKAHIYPGRTSEAFMSPDYADQLEGLVGVTAHEITHLREYSEHRQLRAERNDRLRTLGGPQPSIRRWHNSERPTRFEERRVIELFRANREALLAAWSAEPVRAEKPKQTVQEKRAAKALADLERWQRKLKLAQTKVRKCKQRAAYYEKALAANRGPA